MRFGPSLMVFFALAAAGCSSTTASSGDAAATTDVESADVGLSLDAAKGDAAGTDLADVTVGKDAAEGTDAEALKDAEWVDVQETPDVPPALDIVDVPPVKDVPPAPDIQVTPDVPQPQDTGPAANEGGCPSGLKWLTGSWPGTDLMEPGLACIDCHQKKGPKFSIAGTVDPGFHTDDACGGVSGIKVEITGADGKVLTLTTNFAGNFKSSDAVALPYTARVIDANGKERKMYAEQTDGDCNMCHSQAGINGAPGRIRVP